MADKPVYPAFGGSSFKPPPLSKKSKEELIAESPLVNLLATPEGMITLKDPQNGRVLSNFVKGPSWEILENFERFNQVNDVFNRAFWDSQIATDQARDFFRSHREPLKKWRNASGFEQRDYAIRNAAWHVADVFAEKVKRKPKTIK